VACDAIGATDDLSGYKVILAPCLRFAEKGLVKKLEAFVQAGGTLVLTPQAGSRASNNSMTVRPLPGRLTPLVGATIEEIRALDDGKADTIVFARGSLIAQYCDVVTWNEVLQCAGAEAIAEYKDKPLAGKPAITRNMVQKGQVYYLGVYLPRPMLAAFLAEVLPTGPLKSAPEGVEVCERVGDGRRLLFVINHSAGRVTVDLAEKHHDLISGTALGPKATLAPHGVLVFKMA